MKEFAIEYSVVIPVYNAEKTLDELTSRINKVFEGIDNTYELIFIDDNSHDRSWKVLCSIRDNNSHIRCFRLMRNYGQQNATMCGLRFAQGRYIITLDDDLQNPPEEIPILIDEVNHGYDIVFGIAENNKHCFHRRVASKIIHRFYSWTFKTKGKISAFRIMRSELAKQILTYDLNYTYINGLIAWYTIHVSRVEVRHQERPYGKSGYSFRGLLALSINMMTNFSILPLQIASLLGLLFASLGFLLGLYFIVKKLAFGISANGFTAVITSITFFSGLILFFLGIIGEYLGRIHLNINRMPQYSIRQEDIDEKKVKSP